MEYINKNRKLGLSGLMRVMNDAQTLAASIDSCVEALDELIITYNDCMDDSPQIIEQKRQQYPDKIIVIPYPYHVMGINLSDEEYEYVKTLPDDSPHLLASYYNNALKHVNYKYVVKIDADQIYFTDKLRKLRNDIVVGVNQTRMGMIFGKLVSLAFAQSMGSKKLWSQWHPRHYLQYILVPLFKKQYYKYAISELLNGNAYLALSGVNALKIGYTWYSPMGCQTGYGLWDPYNGEEDTLVFEASSNTYYVPWDLTTYKSNNGSHAFIERFEYPNKTKLNIGLIWFHLKPMQTDSYPLFVNYYEKHSKDMIKLSYLERLSYKQILSYGHVNEHRKCYYNFVHNFDRLIIKKYISMLN